MANEMTMAMRRASAALSLALEADQPIIHIATNDYSQAVALMDMSFFNRAPYTLTAGADGRGEGGYVNMLAVAAREGAGYAWDQKKLVFYLRPQTERALPGKIADLLTDYVEAFRDAKSRERTWYSRVMIYGVDLTLPAHLQSFVERIKIPILQYEDFEDILRREDGDITRADIDWYADRLAGYGERELKRMARIIRTDVGALELSDEARKKRVKKLIVNDKNAQLMRNGKLECYPESDNPEVCGLEPVRAWLDEHAESLKRGAGKDAPGGMLLAGIPGTGKSETAKWSSRILDLPLVKLEMGRILGGLVGDSEHNMEQVLKDLRFLAPCVLWIDELEKALSGAGGKSGDSGVMERLFGMLLTFMQENDRTVFIVATANDISRLPPEFFRNGRFDARFCLMMPTYEECVRIMHSKLQKTGVANLNDLSLAQELVDICAGTRENPRFMTGADIDAYVREAFNYFIRNGGSGRNAFVEAMRNHALTNVKPYGDASCERNMNDIADRYCDMLSRSMLMANGQRDAQLFDSRGYHPERVQSYVYKKDAPLPSCINAPARGFRFPYDEWLFKEIVRHMNKRLALSPETPETCRRDYLKKLNEA